MLRIHKSKSLGITTMTQWEHTELTSNEQFPGATC